MNALRTVAEVFGIGILAAGVIICLAYFGLALAAFLWIVLGCVTVAGLK